MGDVFRRCESIQYKYEIHFSFISRYALVITHYFITNLKIKAKPICCILLRRYKIYFYWWFNNDFFLVICCDFSAWLLFQQNGFSGSKIILDSSKKRRWLQSLDQVLGNAKEHIWSTNLVYISTGSIHHWEILYDTLPFCYHRFVYIRSKFEMLRRLQSSSHHFESPNNYNCWISWYGVFSKDKVAFLINRKVKHASSNMVDTILYEREK